jgi:hypothetical protein
MTTQGKWTVTYVRSNEREDVFHVVGPDTDRYEYFTRGDYTEQDVLDTLPETTFSN